MVGQLFYAFVYGSGPTTVTDVQRRINTEKYGVGTPAEIVARWHLGGVILIDRNTLDPRWGQVRSGNVDSAAATRKLTTGLQAAARADSGVPLLIGTDQEGGLVQRITDGVAPRPAQADIAHQGVTKLRCEYFRLGSQLRALGVNQDFAPDADVLRVDSSVIGSRSFGSDPQLVATDVQAASAGLRAAGVLPTLKHWPGHGGVSADSHETLPVLSQSLASWAAVDRLPFAAARDAESAVMVGHLAFPAADPSGLPATISAKLVQELLRDRLGFTGLVLTDSLEMHPVSDRAGPADIAERAIRSGEDMLLMSPDVPAAEGTLLARMKHDRSFRATVAGAVQRILAAKTFLTHPAATPAGC
jgi:beta-N-acetylhexosaminidase